MQKAVLKMEGLGEVKWYFVFKKIVISTTILIRIGFQSNDF